MKYDVMIVNPMNTVEMHYAVECETEEDAEQLSPILISASSQWRPDQFKVISVKKSIYENQDGN